MISGLVFIALGVTAMIILLWLVHSDTVRYYKSIQDGYVSDMLRDMPSSEVNRGDPRNP
jgi:hypothetical protein